MAKYSEAQITAMQNALKWDYGFNNDSRELAILELEDLERKGCTLEHIGECRGCSAFKNGKCPMNEWVVKHPEYADDELATKIKILEAGGEEAYQEKQKKQEEAKKIAEEESKKHAEKIKNAERILIDNGIEPDEASTVLQAIGFALPDEDLYESKS